jgi:hypothetical protein
VVSVAQHKQIDPSAEYFSGQETSDEIQLKICISPIRLFNRTFCSI